MDIRLNEAQVSRPQKPNANTCAIYSQKLKTRSSQPETRNPKLRNPKLETRNPQLETRNP